MLPLLWAQQHDRPMDARHAWTKFSQPTRLHHQMAGFLPPIIFNSGYTLRRKVFMYYCTLENKHGHVWLFFS